MKLRVVTSELYPRRFTVYFFGYNLKKDDSQDRAC